MEGFDKQVVKRRFKITKEDVRKYGMTPGCRGCIALNRGGQAVNHSETCRERTVKELGDQGDDRIIKDKERREEELTEALMAEEERLFGDGAAYDEDMDVSEEEEEEKG